LQLAGQQELVEQERQIYVLRSAEKKEQAPETQTSSLLWRRVGDTVPETSPLSIFLAHSWMGQDPGLSTQITQSKSLRLFAKIIRVRVNLDFLF